MNKFLSPLRDILKGTRTDYGIHRYIRYRFRQYPTRSQPKLRRNFLRHLHKVLAEFTPQSLSERRPTLLRRILTAVDASTDDISVFRAYMQHPTVSLAATTSRASLGYPVSTITYYSCANQTPNPVTQRTTATMTITSSPSPPPHSCNAIDTDPPPCPIVSQTDTVQTTPPFHPLPITIKMEATTAAPVNFNQRDSLAMFVFDPHATYLIMDIEGPESSPVELSILVYRGGEVIAAHHDYALPLDRAAHDRSAVFCHCIKLSALESLTTQSSSDLLARAAIFATSFLPATILSNDENPNSDIARLARRWLPDVPYSNVFTGPWARRMSCSAHRLAYVFKESGSAICGVHCPVSQLHGLHYRRRSRKSGPNDTDTARNAYGRHCSLADALEITYWLRLNFYSPRPHAPTVQDFSFPNISYSSPCATY